MGSSDDGSLPQRLSRKIWCIEPHRDARYAFPYEGVNTWVANRMNSVREKSPSPKMSTARRNSGKMRELPNTKPERTCRRLVVRLLSDQAAQTLAPPECQAPKSTPKPGEPQGRDGSDDGAQRVHSSFETERPTKEHRARHHRPGEPFVREYERHDQANRSYARSGRMTRSSPRPTPPAGSQTRMGQNESPHLLQPQVSGEPRSTLTHSSVLRGVSARGPANPTGLAHVFLFHSALPGSHDALTPQVPNHSAGIVRIDHR